MTPVASSTCNCTPPWLSVTTPPTRTGSRASIGSGRNRARSVAVARGRSASTAAAIRSWNAATFGTSRRYALAASPVRSHTPRTCTTAPRSRSADFTSMPSGCGRNATVCARPRARSTFSHPSWTQARWTTASTATHCASRKYDSSRVRLNGCGFTGASRTVFAARTVRAFTSGRNFPRAVVPLTSTVSPTRSSRSDIAHATRTPPEPSWR